MANEIAFSSYIYKEGLYKQNCEKYSGLMSQEESPKLPSWSELSTESISGPNITRYHQNQQKLVALWIFAFIDIFHNIFSWNALQILLKDLFNQWAIKENWQCLDKIDVYCNKQGRKSSQHT